MISKNKFITKAKHFIIFAYNNKFLNMINLVNIIDNRRDDNNIIQSSWA